MSFSLHFQKIPLLVLRIANSYINLSKVYSSALHSVAVHSCTFPKFSTVEGLSKATVEIIHERINQKHFCPVCNIHGIIDYSLHNACFARIVYDSLAKLVYPSHDIATICITNRLRKQRKMITHIEN